MNEGAAAPAAAASVWERITRPAPAPRQELTVPRIADAALAIADTDGLAAVSMRRLAAGLGVSAMTCYRYVAGKDEIIELMLDRVRREMILGEPPAGWRAVLRASALRFRAVALGHPWVTDVPGRILLAPTPAYLAVAEQQLAALAGTGLTADQMADVRDAVTAYSRAGTNDEVSRARLRAPEGWSTGREARDANARRLAWLLDHGDYPAYRRVVREGTRRDDEQARFEFGLDCLLDGIAARLGINPAS